MRSIYIFHADWFRGEVTPTLREGGWATATHRLYESRHPKFPIHLKSTLYLCIDSDSVGGVLSLPVSTIHFRVPGLTSSMKKITTGIPK
jgi:hypothetical protein